MARLKQVFETVMGSMDVQRRQDMCAVKNLCFISLKPLTEEAVEVAHAVAGTVKINKEYLEIKPSETEALVQLVEMGRKEAEEGKSVSVEQAFEIVKKTKKKREKKV